MSRKFEGFWIPAAIWEDERLSATEKILAAEVDSFTQRGANFYKTNETIANELKVSPSTIKRAVANLTETGYIERGPFDGRKRTLRSKLNRQTGQPDPAARPKRTSSRSKLTRQVGQTDPAAGPKRPHSNTERSTVSRTLSKQEEVWPWPDTAEVWQAWLDYKRLEHRFTYKSEHSAKAAISQLMNLSNNDPEKARAIIRQSIANGWRGFFPLKNTGGAKAVPTEQDAAKFAEYIRTGNL